MYHEWGVNPNLEQEHRHKSRVVYLITKTHSCTAKCFSGSGGEIFGFILPLFRYDDGDVLEVGAFSCGAVEMRRRIADEVPNRIDERFVFFYFSVDSNDDVCVTVID